MTDINKLQLRLEKISCKKITVDSALHTAIADIANNQTQ